MSKFESMSVLQLESIFDTVSTEIKLQLQKILERKKRIEQLATIRKQKLDAELSLRPFDYTRKRR